MNDSVLIWGSVELVLSANRGRRRNLDFFNETLKISSTLGHERTSVHSEDSIAVMAGLRGTSRGGQQTGNAYNSCLNIPA